MIRFISIRQPLSKWERYIPRERIRVTNLNDALFAALSDPHRRKLLVSLMRDDSQDVLSIPEAVYDGDADLQTLEVELVHVHLPMLEDHGFVDWDRRSQVVVRGPQFEEIEPCLRVLFEHREKLPDAWA